LAAIGPAKSCIQDLPSNRGFRSHTRAVFYKPSAAPTTAIRAHGGNYSRFYGLIEAQSLGDVLPFIRADRPKLPHPVYDIPDYRMRNPAAFSPLGHRNEFSG